MTNRRLKYLAHVDVSNVDKKSSEAEQPVRLCNYTDVYYNENITPELPFMEATASGEQIRRFSLKAGDVLVTKDSETPDDIAVPAFVLTDLPGVVCGYHLALLRPRPDVDGRYLFWALKSQLARQQFSVAANGITRFGLRYDAFGEVQIPLWPLRQQRAFADYLDRETAQIDALITAKRRCGALVSERVRNWLAMQFDGGAGQFGLIKVKYLVHGLRQGWSPQCEDRVPDEAEWSVLKAGAVNGGKFNPNERKALPAQEVVRSEYLVRVGDLLINRANGSLDNLGSVAVVPDDVPERVLLCDKIFRATINESDTDARWLAAMLGAPQARDALLLGVSGAEGMANSLPSSVVLNVEIPRANLEYQRHFVEGWTRLDEDARRVIDALDASIAALQEKRQALITATVTGELSVPREAA